MPTRSHYQTRRKDGKRSGLESRVATQLDKAGIKYGYESEVIRYEEPASAHRYTPDFILSNGIVIEAKGRFLSADRKKHKLIQSQHPHRDIRFVFSNPNQKIGKKSTTTYAMWCEKNGFLYAKGEIPQAWLKESTKPKGQPS